MSSKLIDVLVPDEQKEGTELELTAWLKQVGDSVALHEPIAELTTDKAVVEIPAPAAGVLREILIAPETAVEYDTVLARIEVGAEVSEPVRAPSSAAAPTPEEMAPAVGEVGANAVGAAAPHPAVARLARHHGVDLAAMAGTGRGGRVTKADVMAKLGVPAAAPAAGPPIEGPRRMIRHDAMRRSIARNMRDSVLTAPHVTAVFEVDLSRVMAHREANKVALAEQGIKLTYSAYFLRATAEAVRAVPEVNSRWHDDGLEVFEAVHVGVGTALGDEGLVVPVIRNVQDLDLAGVAEQLTVATDKARSGKLTPADMRGSTITMSNHGVMGSLIASPIIIRQPESAILGIGKLDKRAVVVEQEGVEQVRIRPMMYVTLTIDHRVLDAFHTNRFLTRFCEVLTAWA